MKKAELAKKVMERTKQARKDHRNFKKRVTMFEKILSAKTPNFEIRAMKCTENDIKTAKFLQELMRFILETSVKPRFIKITPKMIKGEHKLNISLREVKMSHKIEDEEETIEDHVRGEVLEEQIREHAHDAD